MKYPIEYFHPRVKEKIESWPSGILADYARMVELLMEFGTHLRMPHSRAMGNGLFELRPRSTEGIGRVFYCFYGAKTYCNTPCLCEKDTRNS